MIKSVLNLTQYFHYFSGRSTRARLSRLIHTSGPQNGHSSNSIRKLDNPGRVVGVPGKVGAKKCFGKKRRTKPPKRESTEEIEARVYARLSADFQSQFALLTSQLEAAQGSRDLSQQRV